MRPTDLIFKEKSKYLAGTNFTKLLVLGNFKQLFVLRGPLFAIKKLPTNLKCLAGPTFSIIKQLVNILRIAVLDMPTI